MPVFFDLFMLCLSTDRMRNLSVEKLWLTEMRSHARKAIDLESFHIKAARDLKENSKLDLNILYTGLTAVFITRVFRIGTS